MFKIDDKDIRKLEDDLGKFAKRSIPFATKNTINTAAFTAQRHSKAIVREKMITRNRFTLQSIRVEQARTLRISRQEATVGSTEDYMEDQEFGGQKTTGGKEGVPIATSYSAGQGEAQPRTRLPRRANKLAAIKLRKQKKKGANRKQQNLIAIKVAAASGRKFVFLDLGKSKGIFKVIGGIRRPRIKMIHSMEKRTVIIPRNPWLAPAVDKTRPEVPKIYKKSLEFQARRQGLFK